MYDGFFFEERCNNVTIYYVIYNIYSVSFISFHCSLRLHCCCSLELVNDQCAERFFIQLRFFAHFEMSSDTAKYKRYIHTYIYTLNYQQPNLIHRIGTSNTSYTYVQSYSKTILCVYIVYIISDYTVYTNDKH